MTLVPVAQQVLQGNRHLDRLLRVQRGKVNVDQAARIRVDLGQTIGKGLVGTSNDFNGKAQRVETVNKGEEPVPKSVNYEPPLKVVVVHSVIR